jgi:hypothetical protein
MSMFDRLLWGKSEDWRIRRILVGFTALVKMAGAGIPD